MREILFRAKHKEYNEWVEGDLIHESFGECIQFIKNKCRSIIKVDPKTVCQYTGLTDKNGRKIFEGDIVTYMDTYSTDNGYGEADCIGEVLWCEEELCFHVTERLSAESWEVLQDCCVIGNIYDNPELVKVG